VVGFVAYFFKVYRNVIVSVILMALLIPSSSTQHGLCDAQLVLSTTSITPCAHSRGCHNDYQDARECFDHPRAKHQRVQDHTSVC
jgi:hypothetical protein